MRIDSHLHVFARPSTEFPREITSSMPAEREAPVEDLLAHMADHAIDKAVLVQTGGTSLAHHAYLQHCLRTYPDRFLGIGLIPPDASAPADHMDRLAEDGSIIGFRLRCARRLFPVPYGNTPPAKTTCSGSICAPPPLR